MDVTIYHMPDHRQFSGRVERFGTRPVGHDDYCTIEATDTGAGRWAVRVRQEREVTGADGGKKIKLTVARDLLPCECGGAEEYEAWLEVNVAQIAVDGVEWWRNPLLDGIDGDGRDEGLSDEPDGGIAAFGRGEAGGLV